MATDNDDGKWNLEMIRTHRTALAGRMDYGNGSDGQDGGIGIERIGNGWAST